MTRGISMVTARHGLFDTSVIVSASSRKPRRADKSRCSSVEQMVCAYLHTSNTLHLLSDIGSPDSVVHGTSRLLLVIFSLLVRCSSYIETRPSSSLPCVLGEPPAGTSCLSTPALRATQCPSSHQYHKHSQCQAVWHPPLSAHLTLPKFSSPTRTNTVLSSPRARICYARGLMGRTLFS